jgi:MoaA/NifB/PqqE/SkfB family radical SAM enzyme
VFCISSAIGEPLLHPELKEVLDWLYELNPQILLQTVTNGTALTADKASWFAGHLDWLSVSLNASNGAAHMRDMFPHLAARGINAQKRWDLMIGRLTAFIAALPSADRPRIRFQMVTHRDNVKDVVEFVRLVSRMGGTYAGLPNISVHPETVDRSLYWIKDQYNEAIEEACEVGARLGVTVGAVRFYTSVKPILDLNKVCRDPIDVAYISRSDQMAPCCQWSEPGIDVDMYSDDGFDRYWNGEVLRKLRRNRDSRSCQVCGMSRVFDESSFHFSPYLKKTLVDSGKLTLIENDYPDAKLVKKCSENLIDLPSIRRTLLRLDLPVSLSNAIEAEGISALNGIERECWAAFKDADIEPDQGISFGGPFLGIGWNSPLYDPEHRSSGRSVSRARSASIFVRTEPGALTKLNFVLHERCPMDVALAARLTICEHPVECIVQTENDGQSISALVDEEITELHDGRLLVKIECSEQILFRSFHATRAEASDRAELLLAESASKILYFEEQVSELKQGLQQIYASRSWRFTRPLRRIANAVRSIGSGS